jgi:Zn-dependent peptidase ImmA (M78 family)
MPATYESPKPIGASKEEIWEFAERIATSLEYLPGDDIEPIVERLGGKVEYLGLTSEGTQTASITVEKDGKFIIQLFQNLFPLQERISIAHELGHLFLHSRLKGVPLQAFHDVDDEDEAAESEAHHFACAFLMPASAVVHAVNCFDKDSPAIAAFIAAFFMVPEPVAHQRIEAVCG